MRINIYVKQRDKYLSNATGNEIVERERERVKNKARSDEEHAKVE